GVEEVADMPRVYKVENAVAHHHRALARARPDRRDEVIDRLDLVCVFLGELGHAGCLDPRKSNQVRVARAIDSGSHSGASRHFSISAIMRWTPSSNGTRGCQPRSCLILVISAQVTSGSPGRFGM